MSLAVRVIPCLDVDAGRVVKGVHFENLKDAGDPVELAAEYYRQGADEITFLDVTASSSHRNTMIDVVSCTAEQVFIPMTVGGGVRTPEDVDSLLRCGADKVGVNTAAINDPSLISRVADRFGNQVLVLSVDARRERVSSIRSPVLRSPRWAAANPPVLMPSGGSSAPSSLAPARFCLTRWTPTAPRKALTSR